MEPGHPGIQVNKGFTCPIITGSFNVLEFDVDGFTVNRFHATFEQHCNNAAAALTGEIVYTPQSPLPQLQVTITVDRQATLGPTGFVKVTGTITCNQYVYATLSVTVTQGSNRVAGPGNLPCSPGAAVPWVMFPSPQGELLRPGVAAVSADVTGRDAFTGVIESGQFEGKVILRRGTF